MSQPGGNFLLPQGEKQTGDNMLSDINTMIYLYHGSDHIVEKPVFGGGKPDNDYGSGFYTTRIKERAEDWALLYGTENAVVSRYQMALSDMNVLNLDDYGPMAWIAEVICNRGVTSMIARDFSDDFVARYKVDTDHADLIVGYRADDSYGDVIESFMSGEITVDEVKKLFYKGELGEQYFIKSRRAFQGLHYVDCYRPAMSVETGQEISRERREVLRFLENRRLQIARRYRVPEISVVEAITNAYSYNREFGYYERL